MLEEDALKLDYALLTDLYQITMAQGYWESGKGATEACFHMYFRDYPFKGGYAVACGMAQLAELVEGFAFSEEDRAYLASLDAPGGGRLFKQEFLDYLAGYRLSVDIDAVPEGTVVGTSPAAGEKLASGSSVTVNVAMSRASVLVPAAKDYLSSIGTISLGGTTYEIVSVDDVKYTGYNQTSFTVTAAAVTTLDGETVRGSAKQKSGTIVWDDSDNVVSVS